MQIPKTVIEKFIKDPDWAYVEEYIKEFFANDTNIQSIDITQGSDVVHAQVIARQSIDSTLDDLMSSFESVKSVGIRKPTSFK